MKKYKSILLIVLLFSIQLKAQDDLTNMKKYWFYHYRLVNDFLAKGDKQGESEPMGQRALGASNSSTAKWGDQTICLAQYISVLATEYKLLHDRSQPTDTTVQELYYALRAFNRLDYTAETNTSYCTDANSLNGFFMRDDVSYNFLINHPKLAQGVTSGRIVNIVKSDYLAHLNTGDRGDEMSQDQVMHLMGAFALVRTCIPLGVSYKINGISQPLNVADPNADIYQEAINITDRIISYIKNSSWIIYIPHTAVNTKVYQGSDAYYIAYGFAEAANYIKWGSSSNLIYFPVVHRYSNPNYQDALSETSCVTPLPFTWMMNGQNAINFIHDDYKRDLIATVGDSWYTHSLIISTVKPVQIISFIKLDWRHPLKLFTEITTAFVNALELPKPVTLSEVSSKVKGINPYNYYHFPLLYQALHGNNAFNYISPNTYTSLLNLAPPCGPYNYSYPNNSSTYEWTADSRVYDAEDRGKGTTDSYGEYNGLDYMLYYNLYHLAADNIIQPTVPTVNYMDRVITIPFPTTDNPPFGTATNPANLIAFNTITASNIANSNSVVTYRAGSSIVLKPGFTAKSGSVFHAYIQPTDPSTCGEYINTNNRSSTPDYTRQTTFVNYPKSASTEYAYSSEVTTPTNDNKNNEVSKNTTSATSVNTQNAPETMQTVSGILVNPNPNNGTFQLMVTHKNQSIGVKEIKVYDMMNNIVWSIGSAEDAVFNIDISGYKPGIYYVRSVNTLGEVEMKKLIKQ